MLTSVSQQPVEKTSQHATCTGTYLSTNNAVWPVPASRCGLNILLSTSASAASLRHIMQAAAWSTPCDSRPWRLCHIGLLGGKL
eukprot:364910-Chlamydomonas_euryale.AAC.6